MEKATLTMIKIAILLLMALFSIWAIEAFSDEGEGYDGQVDEDVLKYNPYKGEFNYEKPDSNLHYNPYDNNWEWFEKGEKLRYNPYNNRFEPAR